MNHFSDNKIISLLVHKDFNNHQFDHFISKNDIEINQSIIHFGVFAYSQILQYAKDKHHEEFDVYTQKITDQLNLEYSIKFNKMNEENIILKNDCKTSKELIIELQNSIHSLKDDKFFEINSLIDKGKQISKEEYQTIFDLQTEKNKKLEDDLQNTYQQIQELNKQLIELKDNKSYEINTFIDKGKQITKEEYQTIFDLQNENNKKLENDLQNSHQQIQELNKQLVQLQDDKFYEINTLIDKGKQITKEEYQIIFDLQSEKIKKIENDLHHAYQQIQELNQKLIDSNHDRYSEIEKEKQILEEKYQTIIDMQCQRNSKLEDNLQLLHQQIQELNNKLIESNKIENHKNIQIVDNSINQLNHKFSNYFDKIFKGNTEKGEYGESFVNNYLSDKFNNSTIIDTHKEFAKGDFIFYLNQIKTLIEVKNVQKLKSDDIDKFYRDIQLQIQKDSINSAILISLNDSNLIQGKRNFVFEIKYNIPIIMISNVFNNPDYIKFSIMIIDYLIVNNYIYTKKDETKEEQNNKIQAIISAINEIFQYIQLQKTYIQEEFNIIQKLTENFKKRENNLFNIEIIIKNAFMNYPQIIQLEQHSKIKTQQKNDIQIQNTDIQTQKNDFDHQALTYIIDMINKNQLQIKNINTKSINALQISNNQIKQAGGIKNIIKQYQILQNKKDIQTEEQKEIKDNL